MNANIYIDDALYHRLTEYTKRAHISRSLLIREALNEWFARHSQNQWRENFFDFEGIKDFPLAEDLRKDMLTPSEDPFQ